jgi:hypothetical protein
MTDETDQENVLSTGTDRRSSVRVRALLPMSFEPLSADDIARVRSRIVDQAVLDATTSFDEEEMWDERSDDLRREVVLVLNEIRALRQKMTELEGRLDKRDNSGLVDRWVTLNDRGLWVPTGPETPGPDVDWSEGDYARLELRLPTVYSQRILAVGRILRVDGEDEGEEDGPGVAVEFSSISNRHEDAITRYALMRERQVARSEHLDVFDD